jgi:pimeloyl-ACP methyl ester carboxylesterase
VTAGLAADAAHGYFGRIWTWASGICAAWDHTDTARYMGPFNRRTANPVLVVGNQFDPATPLHGAVTVANLLPNSALLTLHAWGHTSLFLSACADEAIARYLIDLQTPAPGTVCQQDVVPFSG